MYKGIVECFRRMIWREDCKVWIYKYYISEYCYCIQVVKFCLNLISGLRCVNRGFCGELGIRSYLEYVVEIVFINIVVGLKL